jgi:hypothetical protein
MNSIRLLTGLIICLLLFACNSDDLASPDNSAQEIPNFKAVGEDLENIFQFNYNAESKDGELINLTTASSIVYNYLTLRQIDDVLTFFSFEAGSFSAVQQNAYSGINNFIENFYTVSNERSVTWGTVSNSHLIMGYFSPNGSPNFGVRTINISSGNTIDQIIEFNIDRVYEPLVYNDRLFLTFLDFQDNYKVVVFNTETQGVIKTFNFGEEIPSIFIDDIGDLNIIRGINDFDYTYSKYDFETFNLLEESPFTLNRFFAPGPLDAYIKNNKLHYMHFFVQPSELVFAPAVYDFAGSDSKILDMVGIVQMVEADLEQNIGLTSFGYDPASNTFLVGFAFSSTTSTLTGGTLIIDSNGTLLRTVELPFVPTYFIK